MESELVIKKIFILVLKNRDTYMGCYDPSDDYSFRVVAETLDEVKAKAIQSLLALGQLESWFLYEAELPVWKGVVYTVLESVSTHDDYSYEGHGRPIKEEHPLFVKEILESEAYATAKQKKEADEKARKAEKDKEKAEKKKKKDLASYEELKEKYDLD